MSNHRAVTFTPRRSNRKSSTYTMRPGSLQSELIQRATLIGQRKNIYFYDDAADWLRETVERTTANVLASFPSGAVPFDNRVVRAIELALQRIRLVVETIAERVGKRTKLTAQRLESILQTLCPLPPIC